MPDIREERSIGELFAELASDTTTLVRQEVALARIEITRTANRVGKNVGVLVIGGAIAYAALLSAMAALIMVLGGIMPMWAGAMLVAAVFAALSYGLISKSIRALREVDLTPRQTMETLREDAQWMKGRIG